MGEGRSSLFGGGEMCIILLEVSQVLHTDPSD
jgi:hypothetical protein